MLARSATFILLPFLALLPYANAGNTNSFEVVDDGIRVEMAGSWLGGSKGKPQIVKEKSNFQFSLYFKSKGSNVEKKCSIKPSIKLPSGKIVTADHPDAKKGALTPWKGGVNWQFTNTAAGGDYLNICNDPCESGAMMVCGGGDMGRANCASTPAAIEAMCPEKRESKYW